MNYYIFGAHSRGYTLFEYLRTLEAEETMLGFLYANDEENPSDIEGVPVHNIGACAEDTVRASLDISARVYIATRGVYHDDISDRLREIGFTDIVRVTPGLDMDLRNRYVKKRFLDSGRSFVKLEVDDKGEAAISSVADSSPALTVRHGAEAALYIAKTASDPDFSQIVPLKVYEHIVQVGCELTDKRLTEAEYFDNAAGSSKEDAESISSRNGQFCELTGLYWIWKNATQDIVGLEHWRRRFLLPLDWDKVITDGKADVILPIPLCVMPSLEANYKARHDVRVWDEAMKIVKELHPEDYDGLVVFCRENNLYSPCNMIIARKHILDEYCEWLFPILIKLNDTVGVLKDSYQNRYTGFLSERLLNYFFDKRRYEYKVVYADKSFLV